MSSAAAAAPQRQQRKAGIKAAEEIARQAKKAKAAKLEDGEVRARGGGARSTSKQHAPRLSARTTATATPTPPPHR